MKKILFSIFIIMSIIFTSCGELKHNENTLEEDKVEISENKTIINEIDFSESFEGINGGAVFYNVTRDVYDIYKSDICNEQIPPYSTFKIINTLMGLSKGIVTSEDTKLGYDGTIYWREEWNKDLTLKEAFKESCLWYYQKIMDSLDKDYVQEVLKSLAYGNCDISEWDEGGHNTFWISGSLKISPLEQVKALAKIFEGESAFEQKYIEILKKLMLVEENESNLVYGKTGSARTKDAWFTGFFENRKSERIYFAVRINDESQELAGSVAKAIALDIINNNY